MKNDFTLLENLKKGDKVLFLIDGDIFDSFICDYYTDKIDIINQYKEFVYYNSDCETNIEIVKGCN